MSIVDFQFHAMLAYGRSFFRCQNGKGGTAEANRSALIVLQLLLLPTNVKQLSDIASSFY